MHRQIILGWGKIRRVFLVNFRPNKTSKYLVNRQGECKRCGACCELFFKCSFLKKENGIPSCKIYDWRFKTCRAFPLDQRDINDRDIVNPLQKCGFYFNSPILQEKEEHE
ncbi:MAG: hypothetical protein QME51_05305 [Planctomycetota bacterium]|nr:hypothetical protein [Planctomycetota bacterium]